MDACVLCECESSDTLPCLSSAALRLLGGAAGGGGSVACPFADFRASVLAAEVKLRARLSTGVALVGVVLGVVRTDKEFSLWNVLPFCEEDRTIGVIGVIGRERDIIID